MSTSSTMYFDFMLTLCNDHRLQYQMLRGLVTSASSGSEALLSAARIAISGFVSTKSSADVEMFYENILGIIRVNLPAGRLLWPALEVLAFLLDVDIVPRLTKISDPSTLTLRPPYGWQALLDDMAALHKSSNLRNWETVVHVYTGLARYAGLCERIISILRRLLVHRISKVGLRPLGKDSPAYSKQVRQAAAAGLFVIQV